MIIAFFGTPRFSQIVLLKLIDSPYKPSLVITSPDAKVGRGQQLGQSPVKQTAVGNQIEVMQPEKLSDLTQGPSFLPDDGLVKDGPFGSGPFDLGILVAYGKIIPKEVLDIAKFGFVNVHPSLLPKYRGPSPIHSAILAGDQKTGVTIMKLDEEVDHGPILGQTELKIDKDDTHDSLAEKLANAGADLLLKILPDYLEGKLKPKPQDHSQATFTEHITKQDGYIDLENPPDAITLDRMIRAYYPWPTVWGEVKVESQSGKLRIKFLPNGLIQPEGKKPMTVKEFLNGYPQAKELIEKVFKQ